MSEEEERERGNNYRTRFCFCTMMFCFAALQLCLCDHFILFIHFVFIRDRIIAFIELYFILLLG